ncbi:hypothetical protein EB796_008183 [Bugula neritina]|uniref:Uncharacterized protein n=1 Tax=Bugula neritina TaxID=10212 RepID=A0A7J7K5I7_BUGNE|nr:hypothetical protein EB796_008183 [Bugula neritina]
MLFLYFSASTNLANRKATYSKTSTNDSHRPKEAVDGESNSYFQSSTSANQWWRVDLGRSYYVGVIKVYSSQYEKFQQVSIFLSNIGTVPTSPLNLPNNNDWTELPLQFSLKESGDDFVTNVTSSQDGSLLETRHIAVYSTSSGGLVINEVEVYGYEVLTRNVAVGKSVGSSSVLLYIPSPRTADKANDGLINSDDFYRSENDVGDQWWKVDLDTQYFIVGVLVYNRKNSISRLQKAHLLAANTDIYPNPNSIEWTELYYQDEYIIHSIPNNYFQYNPIDEGDPLSVYRYVAVYSKYKPGLALSEVLVFGIAPDKADELLVINNHSLIFQKSQSCCLSDEECGFSAYKEVEVEVKVVGSDKTESTTLTTNCADPSKPRKDNLQHVKVFNLGREMWKYVISWKAPSSINCESITEYKIRYPDVTSEEIVTTDTSYEVYVEGGVEFTLSVRAVNNMGLHSNYLDITETSPDIAPQWGSATVTMETLNSSCVELTWIRPEYPGGDITSCQLTCTNMAAMDKLPSTSTSQTVCGYSAYTLVECNISAENRAGSGEFIEFNSVYTGCEAPVLHLPANLSSYVKQERSMNLIRIFLNISNENVTVNCDELTQLVYRVDTETEYTDVGEYIEGLQPGTEYTVEIRAENNAGLGTTHNFDIITVDVERVCPPPPPVRNAETLSTQSDWKIDSVVTYLCLEGYYRTGNAQLTCVVEDGKAVWLGEVPECDGSSEYITALLAGGVACGLVILILITIIIILVRQLYIRKYTDSTQQRKSTDEYEEVGPNHLHPVMSLNNSVELPVSGIPHPPDVEAGSVYESIDKKNTVADGIKDYTGLEDVSFSSNYEHIKTRQSGNNYERMNYDDKPKPQANKVYENCDKD